MGSNSNQWGNSSLECLFKLEIEQGFSNCESELTGWVTVDPGSYSSVCPVESKLKPSRCDWRPPLASTGIRRLPQTSGHRWKLPGLRMWLLVTCGDLLEVCGGLEKEREKEPCTRECPPVQNRWITVGWEDEKPDLKQRKCVRNKQLRSLSPFLFVWLSILTIYTFLTKISYAVHHPHIKHQNNMIKH